MSLTKMNKMDKSSVVNTFTGLVEQLRSKECSQSEKIACFQQIAECIKSDALVANINYATHCSTAINVLLLFCEDLDSVVRMSAEENLNKIFRVLEKTRVSRILMDLYGEIKRNGNQRSLRICLNLFAHYVPQVREKHVKWYALRLLTCIETIAQRKETLLCETLSEFVNCFGKYLQSGLTDSETCKLFEVFIANIGVECAVKRRCSARNCISLIENARNKSLMAKHGLNKVIELLLNDQKPQAVLGALVLLRLLLPLIIRGLPSECNDEDNKTMQKHEMTKNIHKINDKMSTMPFECKQIIEIYDYCLHLLSTSNVNTNHSIINGALEVISAVLQALDQKSYNNNNSNTEKKKCNNLVAQTLLEVLSNQNQLQHNEMLRKRKSLKNQIFQLKNYHEIPAMSTSTAAPATTTKGQYQVLEGDEEQLTSKNMKITSADRIYKERREQLLTEASSSSVDANKLEIQNISYEQDAMALRAVSCDEEQIQQHHQQEQQIPQLDKISNVISLRLASDEQFTASTSITTKNVKNENELNQESCRKMSAISKPDANDHKSDVVQVVRNTPRSISECVEDESIILGVAGCMISDEREGECCVEDDDDFTTLSEINEPQATFALTTKIDVDNLIDAMDAANIQTTVNETAASVEEPSIHLAVTSSISAAADDKSQLLSDIDNDSFNSIDFEAEITIAGLSTTSGKEKSSTCSTMPYSSSNSVRGYANLESKSSGSDTIGAFFNHLISHSNAASESVGKFFRQSSTSTLKPLTKSSLSTNEQTESMTGIEASDSISFVSNASSGIKVLEVGSPITAASLIGEDTASESASATASTALVVDENEKTNETAAGELSSDEEVSKMSEIMLRTNRKINPFLSDSSPLKDTTTDTVLPICNIGSIHEQCLLRYTARLITSRFLLPQDIVDFLNETDIRISIKSLSLIVLAQCVRLTPIILEFSVEINSTELHVTEKLNKSDLKDTTYNSKNSSGRVSYTSTNIGSNYEHVDNVEVNKRAAFSEKMEDSLLLDIKDDHFGTGSNNYMFNTPPLSRSVDMVLLPASSKIEQKLSRSAIISSPSNRSQTESSAPRPPKRTKSMSKSKSVNKTRNMCDVLQYYNHADPVMRAGVQTLIGNFIQANGGGSVCCEALNMQYILALLINGLQDEIHTVVVQSLNAFDKIFPYVVSKYLSPPPSMHHYMVQLRKSHAVSSNTMAVKNVHEENVKKVENSKKVDFEKLQQQRLQLNSAFLECCTNDVIETLPKTTSSSKISIVNPQQQQQQQQHSLFTDNDELIAALLNAFQFQFKYNNNNNNNNNNKMKVTNSSNIGKNSKIRTQSSISTEDDNNRHKNLNLFPCCISPKLLLNKLRLCYHHKYWLIQNKYIEVISNLNYTATLHSFYGHCNISDKNSTIYTLDYVGDVDDLILAYEMQFLDELLQLLGDDDFRVREHAAFGLCRFIKSHAKQHLLKCSNIKAVEKESVTSEPLHTRDPATKSAYKKLTTPPVMPYILGENTCQTNFNLFWDFFDYHIFSGMPLQLRNLFKPDAAEGIDNEDDTIESIVVEIPVTTTDKRFMEEQKVLSKVLYQMTNKMMQLNDQNLQFGIIHALKLLLQHYNFIDYGHAYSEFNFAEICMKYARYNYNTAVDLNCQRDLIEIMSKLIAGLMINDSFVEKQQQQQQPLPSQQHELLLQQLLIHTLKIINMYFYVLSNQKPLFFAKVQKSDLFSNAKELAIVQSIGYFGNDYTYIKLYNLLLSANNSYKLSVSSESGVTFIALLKTCLHTLSLCIELSSSVDVGEVKATMFASVSPSHTETKEHSSQQHLAGNRVVLPANYSLKLIEEVVQYLTKLINYVPRECITCVRQLLKYLFAQNYGSRRIMERQEKQPTQQVTYDYDTLLCFYLAARRCQNYTNEDFSVMSAQYINCGMNTFSVEAQSGNNYDTSTSIRLSASDHYRYFGGLIAGALKVHSWKSEFENDCAKHIKLFEPIVVFCMTIFMKSDFRVQAPILELLSQLLEHNVTYSVLDAKNVIFDQIVHNIELIDGGIIRNAHIIIPPMIKFLVQLTHKSDRKLITIPKIISFTNNLLANNAISESALLAFKCLTYEIFFVCPTTVPTQTVQAQILSKNPLLKDENNRKSTNSRNLELDTQREVILGMLEKFIDTVACQRVLGMLLFYERCIQQSVDDPVLYSGLTSGVVIPGGSKLTDTNNDATYLQSVPSVENTVHRVLSGFACADGRLQVDNWNGYLLLDALFRNYCKNVLADSKEFLGLLQLFINADVTKFSDLSHATIILANVIRKTEEIYLVNHIKLYMKNNPNAMHFQFGEEFTKSTGTHCLIDGPSTSSAAAASVAAAAAAVPMNISEIEYFAKVLCLKLCNCFNLLLNQTNCTLAENRQQYALIIRFVSALEEVCCQSSHKDALQSVFRLVLNESDFLDKYYNFVLMCSNKQKGGSMGVYGNDEGVKEQQQLLQVEVFKLLSAMKLLNGMLLLQQIQTLDIKWNVQRTLLHEVCLHKKNSMDWNLEQVRQLFGLNVNALEFLITEQFEFTLNLCSADEEFCSLLQNALLKHASALKQSSIRSLVHLIWRIYSPTRNGSCSIQCVVRFLELVTELHRLHNTNKIMLMSLERLVCKLLATISTSHINAILEHLKRVGEKNKSKSAKCILELCEKHFSTNINEDNLNVLNSTTTTTTTKFENIILLDSRIIDEKWLYTQLIKFSTQTNYDAHQLTKILLEIQSEYKLHKIFNTPTFDIQKRVLRHAIAISLDAMLAEFRNKCIQHNPYIHYMQPNPLARVACSVLMARIESVLEQESVPLMGPAERKAEADAHVHGDTENDETVSVTCTNTESMAIECGFKLVSEAQLNLSIGDNADTYVYTNLVQCVIVYLEWLRNIEQMSLMYIEARFIERFLREHFLQDNQVCYLVRFVDWICKRATTALLLQNNERNNMPKNHIYYLFHALDMLLKQKFIWHTVNQGEHGQQLLKRILELIVLASKKMLQNTSFYRQFIQKVPTFNKSSHVHVDVVADDYVDADVDVGDDDDERVQAENAIFIAKLIEALNGNNENDANKDFQIIETETSSLSIHLLKSIGITLLRTNQYYAYAVTPFEIMQQQLHDFQGEKSVKSMGKMPTIPLESLSDVDVLRNFVKRLSIFGYTARQQFEEYFMTFLLLINKVYDENMVDLQEQFQIKSTCLEAILELLITYKTFPIVGNKLSYFQHTTRWSRINCENISVKKLHKVQMLISPSNVFYHANLERQLTCDSVIGTKDFYYNQYDLNFVWQQMEAYAQYSPAASEEGESADNAEYLSGSSDKSEWTYGKTHAVGLVSATGCENVAIRNYRYFATLSGVDFKSSSQLIFDVLMQMIEQNHIMVLPNLLRFCEICECRDQIKWIKDKCMKLLETLPIDDTISHQHLIYLVCRTQAMLIPTLGELQQLCSLIGNYLKSSHVFIRNAALSGVLALLECCYKTNTTIGKLNDELDLLRDLIIGYINRHGIIDESSMNCCDTHLKLVWTLNFCLIEWTSKFVPQCHLLSNAIISANNFLRKTSNEDVYLCVLHGLERVVVNSGSNINENKNTQQTNSVGVVTPNIRLKIEKLALELVKRQNERFSIPALKLLLSCIYTGSHRQLEITELSNGIVQDDPEIIAQQTDKVDILLHCIKSSTRDAAWIYGQVLCQIIRDLVPPNEILTKVIKEFLVINQPHRDVIAMIVYQVFRSAIDSSFLQMLQDWLICSLPTFLTLPEQKGVWSLSVIFISSSINLHLIKLFPAILRSERYAGGACSAANSSRENKKLGQHDIALFMTAAQDFHGKLSIEQKKKFKDSFQKYEEQHQVYAKMLHSL